MKYLILLLSIMVLSGCATTTQIHTSETDLMRLIEKTAQVAPEGVPGEFIIHVKAAGRVGEKVYLNSELDYRDRRNISIALLPDVPDYYEKKHQKAPEDFFINKKVKVKGIARQVKIWFTVGGKKSSKYYFQTHIRVSSPEQLVILNAPAAM